MYLEFLVVASQKINAQLDLTDKEYGMFGLVNYFGSFLGSLAFTLAIEKINHKTLICSMLLIAIMCFLISIFFIILWNHF